jgi:hypothetical protein
MSVPLETSERFLTLARRIVGRGAVGQVSRQTWWRRHRLPVLLAEFALAVFSLSASLWVASKFLRGETAALGRGPVTVLFLGLRLGGLFYYDYLKVPARFGITVDFLNMTKGVALGSLVFGGVYWMLSPGSPFPFTVLALDWVMLQLLIGGLHSGIRLGLALRAKEVREAARAYMRGGWQVLPVPLRSKEPAESAGRKVRVKEWELTKYFRDWVNVGILTGDISGGLADADLDTPEAIPAGRVYLPPTDRMHGHPGNPNSHYWYVCNPPIEPKKFLERPGWCVAEIRSSGQYTVVPPSLHPNGGKIIWEREGEPARVSHERLITAMGKVASVALLARNWPAPEQCREAAVLLAAMLLDAGWAEEETRQFVSLVGEAVLGPAWREEESDAIATAKKLTQAERETARARLAAIIRPEVIASISEWLKLESAN